MSWYRLAQQQDNWSNILKSNQAGTSANPQGILVGYADYQKLKSFGTGSGPISVMDKDTNQNVTVVHGGMDPNGKFAFAVWGAKEEQSSLGAFFQAFANHHELSELPHGPLFGVTDFDTYNTFISNASLKNFKLEKLNTTWNMQSLDPLMKGCWDWGNLHLFPENKQNDIKSDVIKNCESFKTENGYSFPHSAMMGYAEK